jgi:pilus assembly protein Flp/PilA
MRLFQRFLHDESGATSVEYAVIAGILAVVIVAGLTLVGSGLTGAFDSVAGAFETAAS